MHYISVRTHKNILKTNNNTEILKLNINFMWFRNNIIVRVYNKDDDCAYLDNFLMNIIAVHIFKILMKSHCDQFYVYVDRQKFVVCLETLVVQLLLNNIAYCNIKNN